MSDRKPQATLVGLLRIREHCLFTWRGWEDGTRSVEISPQHCLDCVAEVRRRGYVLVDSNGPKSGT